MPRKECYPKDQLSADDLLPKDRNSKWAAVRYVSCRNQYPLDYHTLDN